MEVSYGRWEDRVERARKGVIAIEGPEPGRKSNYGTWNKVKWLVRWWVRSKGPIDEPRMVDSAAVAWTLAAEARTKEKGNNLERQGKGIMSAWSSTGKAIAGLRREVCAYCAHFQGTSEMSVLSGGKCEYREPRAVRWKM